MKLAQGLLVNIGTFPCNLAPKIMNHYYYHHHNNISTNATMVVGAEVYKCTKAPTF